LTRPRHRPIEGEWIDIDEGQCQACRVERRLYSPLTAPELRLCVTCSQVAATSSIPNGPDREAVD
jgi:hypothetical protein